MRYDDCFLSETALGDFCYGSTDYHYVVRPTRKQFTTCAMHRGIAEHLVGQVVERISRRTD